MTTDELRLVYGDQYYDKIKGVLALDVVRSSLATPHVSNAERRPHFGDEMDWDLCGCHADLTYCPDCDSDVCTECGRGCTCDDVGEDSDSEEDAGEDFSETFGDELDDEDDYEEDELEAEDESDIDDELDPDYEPEEDDKEPGDYEAEGPEEYGCDPDYF